MSAPCPRIYHEDLVDYLLGLSYVSGFTAYKVNGHGDHQGMNIAEQVSGRRARMQVEIILDASDIADLLGGLGSAVGKDITYWEQLIRNRGEIS